MSRRITIRVMSPNAPATGPQEDVGVTIPTLLVRGVAQKRYVSLAASPKFRNGGSCYINTRIKVRLANGRMCALVEM